MKRNLPKLQLGARPGVRSDISTTALRRWSPDLVSAQTGADDDATISILDPIGSDMFGDGVTAKRISGALRAIGQRPVTVNVNSPGGDVFEGIAIYNLLREHAQPVTVNVLGLAASAASIIAMAGDTVRIGKAGFVMIHNSWVLAMGNRHDLREVAEWLEPFDAAMAQVYADRTGGNLAEITRMMDAETWIDGARAIERGFADELLPADAVGVDARAEGETSLRAERRFDLVAARAGLSRAEARDILKELRGAPGAAPDGVPGAADLSRELSEIAASLKP